MSSDHAAPDEAADNRPQICTHWQQDRKAGVATGQKRAEARILDRAHLGRLAANLGAAGARELIADGLIELSDRLDRLAAGRDRRARARLARDVAGLAGQLGLSRLAELAGRLAHGAVPGDADALAAVREARTGSLDALRAWLVAGQDGFGA